MDLIRRVSLPSILVMVTLTIILGSAWNADAYKRQSNRQKGVTVAVQPTQLAPGRKIKFDIRMNTHSVELNHDMVSVATLVDNNGNQYRPLNWDGSSPSGHHRSGTLQFPVLEGSPNSIKLILTDIAGVPERIFTWKVVR